MYKKILLLSFSLLIGIIILDYIDDLFTESFSYYLLSMSVLGLGITIYPFDFKFKSKVDFIFLIVKAVAVFNIVNLFVFRDFSLKLNYINSLAGLFGIFFLFTRINKLDKNKCTALYLKI